MWGLVLCCMAGVKNYSGALAVRFFLGVFEAAVTPGFALFTSQVVRRFFSGAKANRFQFIVVYEERARHKSRYLVQLQRMGTIIWRFPRLRNRERISSPWIYHCSMEDRFLSHRLAYHCNWHPVPYFHAR